ncbi:MAG: hypothetical protein R3F10_03495 [Lysobacteraceae bacterium]
MALSVAREGRGDWSPEAVLWLYAMADCDEDLIRRRLMQYTLYAAARAGIHVQPDALALAVGDAMDAVRYPHGPRKPPSDKERALQIRMRKETFGFMRGAAERLLMTAIQRGIRNYFRALGYAVARWEPVAPTARQTRNHDPETLEPERHAA